MAVVSDMEKYNRSMRSFLGKIRNRVIKQEVPIENWTIQAAQYVKPGVTKLEGEPHPIAPGTSWFGETVYFRASVTAPPEWKREEVYLFFQNDGESLLYVNGQPVMGFDPNRDLCSLGDAALYPIDIQVESSIRWQFFAHARQNGMEYPHQIFRRGSLVTINREVYQCWNDLSCLQEHLNLYNSRWSFNILEQARRLVKPDETDDELFLSQVRKMNHILDEAFQKSQINKQGPEIIAAGGSHLDLAYLWQAKETVRKCGRTISNMLYLLDRYSEFTFTHSQSVLYEFAKEYYPTLYARIKEYVSQGRWENVCGMYVEADGNIPSGESYIRQLLYGEKILRDEFGEGTRIGWLPDTFGLSGILPQIFKKSGIDYFYSAKLRSNEHYKFPYSVYRWEGIDGSRLLCTLDIHGTYNGAMTLKEMQQGQDEYSERELYPEQNLYVYGFGDGGGGVTSEMLDRMPRYAAMPGVPHVRPGKALEYFQNLEKAADSLPVWSGEHYYDVHQGTLTSHAILKWWNRKLEFKLYEAELLSLSRPYCRETAEMLDDSWKVLLFHQFHDVLAGSHQKPVADQAVQEYERANKNLESFIRSTLSIWDGQQKFFLWNPLGFKRNEYFRIENLGNWQVCTDSGDDVPVQPLADGSLLIYAERLPAMGYKGFHLKEAEVLQPSDNLARENDEYILLENNLLSVKLSKADGSITTMYDKETERHLIAEGGRFNRFEIFDEMYEFYDAWNIHPETLRHPQGLGPAETVQLVENGALMAEVQLVFRFSRSAVCQNIRFYRDSRRIDFDTEVEWHETSRMLKTVFDTSIFSTKAAFDLSSGNCERSTRNNFIFEQSQIETAAHKWADLSDGGYGIALLNDCKYGYSIKESSLKLTLLKSSNYPDTKCDRGRHHFTYAIFPHPGDFRQGQVDREAYCLNVPLLLTQKPDTPDSGVRVETDQPSVFVSALKYAQDGSGDIILRLFENHGSSVKANIQLSGFPLREAFLCDMLENIQESLSLSGKNQVTYTFQPYEILSLRLRS